MPQVSIPGFIHAKPASEWDSSQNVIDGHAMLFMMAEDMRDYGYVMVCPYTMTFEMPEGWDPRAQQIDALQMKKAEHVAAITQIDRQISNLLAIEQSA